MNWGVFYDQWPAPEAIRQVNFLPYAEYGDYIYGICHQLFPVEIPIGAFIAGGYAVSAVASTPHDDIDVWLPPEIQDWVPGNTHTLSFESQLAKSYLPKKIFGDKIHVMKIRYSNPLDLIRCFDISICQAVLYYPNKAIIHRDLWNYLQTGVARATCTAHDIKRVYKYARRFTTPLQDMFSGADLEKAGLRPGWTQSELNALLRARTLDEEYEEQEHLEMLI